MPASPVPCLLSSGSYWWWRGMQTAGPWAQLSVAGPSNGFPWPPPLLSAWSPAWYHPSYASGQKWSGWVREEALQENSSTAGRRNNKNSECLEFMTCRHTTFVTTSPGNVILLHFTDEETETERGCDVHRPGILSLACLPSVRTLFLLQGWDGASEEAIRSSLAAGVPRFLRPLQARTGWLGQARTLPPAFQENVISLPPGLNSSNYRCSWLHL